MIGNDVTILGGVERVISGLAKSFCESGKYSVVIVSVFSSKGVIPYFIPNNVKIIHLNLNLVCGNTINQILQYFNMIFTLSDLCKKEKIDIIIGTDCRINAFLPFVKNCKTKIATEHLSDKVTLLRYKIIKRLFYPMLNCLVCLTSADAKNYSYVKKVKVIPNQLPFVSQKQAELKNNVVLAAGRLVKQKGFDILIDIVSEIRDKCGDWRFRIVGYGEEEINLKKQIKNFELDKFVEILPATDNIIKEYTDASIYALPSRFEGFGLVLIEAMACGLPIVSFDCPDGPADIIANNEDGFLIENGNKQAFSEALLKLMYDENLRKNFGKEAIKNVKKFNPDKIFEMWDDLFEELVNTGNIK